MATILSFPAPATAPRPIGVGSQTCDQASQAAIIIFPGVRKEALDGTGKGASTGRTHAKPVIQ